MAQMNDISDLSIADSTTFQVTHPVTGENYFADKEDKLPVMITVASTASKPYRAAVSAMHNRSNIRKRQGKKDLSAEEEKEEGVKLLTACFLGAENLFYKGNLIEDQSDFRELLADDKMSWLKLQVDQALGNIANFINQSLTA
jgi:hypothetical protein